jgi:SAM-dependent methyltransferase
MAEIRELRRTRPPTEVPDEVFAGSADPLARAASVVARGPGGIRAQSSHVGAPAVLLRRVLNRALFPYIAEQHDLHRALVDVVTGLDARARAAEEAERALRARIESLERQLADVAAEASGARADAARLGAELTATPYAARPEALRTRDPRGRPAIGFASAGGDASGYVGFEDVFRGPEDFIRERQRVYLEVIDGRAPVVDVGSGRGEFLDLMREAGIAATGVDLDEGMVGHARAKGHEVALGDGVAHLEGLEDESLGVVFSAQLIEHLEQGALVEFLDVAKRKLKPGGLFVAETVNPHSIQAFKAYWTDRTHEPPVFPEVAVTLCRLAGFESAWVLFPNGSGDLERDRTTSGEYAVVASA